MHISQHITKTLKELVERVKRFLWNRQQCYQQVFNSPVGQTVLADLAKFCRASVSTFHDDDRIHAKLDGRREVFLRIADHLHLTQDQLYELATGAE